MIPNNQFWFNNLNSGSLSNYYVNPLNLNIVSPKMDGVGLVSYGGNLRATGGWNPDGVFVPGPNTNKQFESSDDGKNYTEITAAPWTERHTHFCLALNGKIFIGGGWGNADIPLKDVWTYDAVNGWVQTTSNWGTGVGNRFLTSSCIHNGYILIAGGQDDQLGTTIFTDIWKTSDGITFTKLCDLPASLTHFSAGVIYSFNNKIYLAGGAKYVSGSNNNNNDYCYVSSDNGSTWTNLGAVPTPMTGIYQNGVVWDGKMWFLCGSKATVNTEGLYYTTDGITWTAMYDAPAARHATGMTVHNDKLFTFCGNFYNDSWCIQKETIRHDGYISTLLTTWYNTLAVKPSSTLIKKLSVLMDGLSSDGFLDETYLLAPVGFSLETDEQRMLPLKTTSGNAMLLVNSPTTSSSGITSNGTTSYVNLKWNMVTNATGAQNDLSFAIWCEDILAQDKADMGVFSGTNQSFIGKKFNDNHTYYSLNDAVNYGPGADDADYFLSINRVSSIKRTILSDYQIVENASNSVAAANFDIYGCGANNAGTPSLLTTRKQRLFFVGSGDARTYQLRQRLEYFLVT